jgi:NADPH:quinone reductase
MTTPMPQRGLQLRSLIQANGELELALHTVEVAPPEPTEVVVRVEAAPINPSDIGLLFGAADLETLATSGSGASAKATARVPERALRAMAGRAGQSLPVGNEGAGVVVAAGSSAAAQTLLGKTVALLGGAMYAQYRTIKEDQCLVLPPGTKPAEGASCFVNPLTALGMVETMRREGHKALVHTAAASNLGQMLNKLCLADGVQLVNIVRNPEQEKILEAIGAKHIVNSTAPDFREQLTAAVKTTGATLGFDAVGGGPLAGQILAAMEEALVADAPAVDQYGSRTHKQVYAYGRLDLTPTTVPPTVGMAWGVGGWLLFSHLARIGQDATQKLRDRVTNEITTTFASSYTREISLAEALDPDIIRAYRRAKTGEKYLLAPSKDAPG